MFVINKMVLVNGEEISVYKLDTEKTLLSRIAAHLDTLPRYVYGLPPNLLKKDGEIQAKNLLAVIKKDGKKSTDFAAFLAKNSDRLGNLDLKKDVLYVWLVYNSQIESFSQYSPIFLEQFGQSLVDAGYFPTTKDFINFWKTGKEGILKELEREIRLEKSNSEKYTKLYETFEAIEDGLGYTDFKTERVILNMILDVKDVTILEIFNNLMLNETMPFAICKTYYKILKDFVPPEDWTGIKGEDNVKLKMHEKVLVDPAKHRDYTDVQIGVSGPIGDEKVDVTMKLITERGYLSRDQFIERFLAVFQHKISYTSLDETEVLGTFYFPQERINTYVFSDLVMNNSLFSSLIDIDESRKATKKKTDSTQPWLYIHFNHPACGHVTAAITQKIVDRSDSLMREEDPDIFPHGQPYIRVRVKGRDRKSIEFFQEMFAKLLVIYNENYDQIVQIYEQYIPDFGVIEEIEVPPLKQSDLAPEIFVSNFSRYCSEARYPTIVSDKKAAKYEKQGKEIMVFPRNKPENGPFYASDGKNQHTYVCLNPEYPYPGLQVNTKLANSEEYPYLPCCFKNDQSSKAGGVYRNYYFSEEKESKDKKQQDLITTDKILGEDKYGTLPEELQKFFEVLDSDTNYKYIRLGVIRSTSSFINAVMVGLQEENGFPEETPARMAEVELMRVEMKEPHVAILAQQSCYDMNVEQIASNLENPEVYINPRLYAQLLENFVSCNIFIFNRDGMILPRFTQGYYTQQRQRPCVFIYEHWGSESDNAKYPQCELIVKWNVKTKDDTSYFFDHDSAISQKMFKVFQLLNQSYALNKKIVETAIPEKLEIVSQKIDSYGKTRCINVKHRDGIISLLTAPIAPVVCQEYDEKIYKVEVKKALKFLRDYDTGPNSQVLENPSDPVLVQIDAQIGDLEFSIPVLPDSPLPGVDSSYGATYPKEEKSVLATFNQNQKIVRYITEYLFWVFSKYIQKENIDKITDKVLARFAKNYFEIDEKHVYEIVPKIFGDNNSILRNGKLIVQSEEMIKRLLYVLKLYSIRDIKTLREYHARKAIARYYVDITDFDYYPNQVILQGENAMEKLIQESKFSMKLNNGIVVGQSTPYFFKNDLVDKKVFIAQNTTSLESALAIAANWQKSGYNSGFNTDPSKKKYSFNLYSYSSPENISEQSVAGKYSLDRPIRILGYKLARKPFYTTLLEI